MGRNPFFIRSVFPAQCSLAQRRWNQRVVIPSSLGQCFRPEGQVANSYRPAVGRNPFFIRSVFPAKGEEMKAKEVLSRNPFFIRTVFPAPIDPVKGGDDNEGRNPFFIRSVFPANRQSLYMKITTPLCDFSMLRMSATREFLYSWLNRQFVVPS